MWDGRKVPGRGCLAWIALCVVIALGGPVRPAEAQVTQFLKEAEALRVLRLSRRAEAIAGITRTAQVSVATKSLPCVGGSCRLAQTSEVLDEVEALAARQVGAGNTEQLGNLLEADGNELVQFAEDMAAGCGRDPACLEEAAERAAKSSWFRRLVEKSCLGRHPEAMKAALYFYVVAYSSLAMAYAATDNPEFPFDYAAQILVANLMYSNIGCLNTFERNGTTVQGSYYSWRNLGRSYLAYAKLEPFNVAMFVGFSMTEDAIRGYDVTDPAYLEKYAREAAFIVAYDLAFINARAVAITDPLYMRLTPKMGAWFKGQLGAGLGGLASFTADTGLRVGQRTGENALLLTVRQAVAPPPAHTDQSPSAAEHHSGDIDVDQ